MLKLTRSSHAQSAALLGVALLGATLSVSVLCSFQPRLAADDPVWAGFFPDGIFNSQESSTFDEEVRRTSDLLRLKPNMTYCEMGAANGLWAAALAASFMPGGRVIATVGTEEEKSAFLATMARAGIPAIVARGEELQSGFPQDESCDAIMSRMSFFFVSRPKLYAMEFFSALRPGGRMLISDHGPMVGDYKGPRGMSAFMKVTMATEATDFQSAGFELLQQLDWTPFFMMGFANLFVKGYNKTEFAS